MKTYKDWICRYYSEHEDGEPDGEIIQELIRCKECRYFKQFAIDAYACTAHGIKHAVTENEYCSRAERKEHAKD